MTTLNLTQKAMLARLTISQFSANKQDKTATASVKDQFGTADDAGRYNKALIAKAAIKAVQQAANEARTYHYQQTLPWKDDGARILPSKNYLAYTEGMRKLKGEFNKAVATFVANYPDLINEARTRLAGLFNPDEYPAANEVEKKYCFEVQTDPLPTAQDFRVDLQPEEVAKIRAEIEARTNQAQQAANFDLWKRLNVAIEAMKERLSEPEAIFRDSLVRNIAEVTDIIPRLNLTEDKALDRITAEAKEKLTAHTPQELRADINVRKQTAQDAADLLAKMASYMGM